MATMRQDESPTSDDKIQPPKKQRKRKPRPEEPEGSFLPHLESSHRERGVAEKQLQKAGMPHRESAEPLEVQPRKRTRIGRGQPNANPIVDDSPETQNHIARHRSVRARTTSSRQSHSRLRNSRSVTLSAEPPPSRSPTESPPTRQEPSHDPGFEMKRRAREEFRETRDYTAFHTLLAPFRKGNAKRELSDWVFDEQEQRFWREDKSSGLVIWAPTVDSFL